jgi:transcription initiation factor IIE alpha subunit
MIKCDKCDEEFELKVQVTKYHGGIEKSFLKCPCCGERYTVSFTDKGIRAKQYEINKLRDKLSSAEVEDVDSITKQIDVIKNYMRKNILRLRAKFEAK